MANRLNILLLILVISLASCGRSSSSPNDEDSKTTSEITNTTSGGTTSEDASSSESTTTSESITTSNTSIEELDTKDEFDTKPGDFYPFKGTPDNLDDLSSIYDGYYVALKAWKNGSDLKQQLFNIIYDEETYSPLDYNANWSTNSYADQSLYNFDNVHTIYNVNEQNKNDTYSSSNTYGWQREHAFCASLLTGKSTSEAVKSKGIATDFHNLFASNGSGNASRSDKNFGIVSDESDELNRSTTNRRDGFNYKANESTFEPSNSEKGMLSRAILYMATMYGQDSWNNNKYKVGDGVYLRENACSIGDNHCMGNSSTLVNWANEFDVNRYEYQHNAYVFSEQHNRNPYVDFPNLVDYVFGNKKNEPGSIKDLVSSYQTLKIGENEISNIAIKDAKTEYGVGSEISKQDLTVFNVYNNYSTNELTDFKMMIDDNEITSSYQFTDSDKEEHIITISSLDQSVSYKIVVKEAGIEVCSNIKRFNSYAVDGSATSRDEVRAKAFSIDDSNWTIDFVNPNDETKLNTAISNDKTRGVKIGSTTAYFDSMVITSSWIENIDKIYFEGATSASTSESVFLKVLDEENNAIYTKSLVIDANHLLVHADLPLIKSGHIQIVFNNTNHKAIYLSSIAFNIIKS